MIGRLLFEQPVRLLIVLVICQFALISLWSWRRTTACARAVWIGFALVPLLLVVCHLVMTQRERVIVLCNALAEDVDDGDVPAIGRRLTSDFSAADLDREAFLARLIQALTRRQVDRPRLRGFEIAFPAPGQAIATFDASCEVRSAEAFAGRLPSRWRLTCRERAGEWLVAEIEALPAPLSPIRDLRDWLP